MNYKFSYPSTFIKKNRLPKPFTQFFGQSLTAFRFTPSAFRFMPSAFRFIPSAYRIVATAETKINKTASYNSRNLSTTLILKNDFSKS